MKFIPPTKALLAIALTVVATAAAAADYPSRPIALVVPFAAGSTADGSARVVGQQLAKTLGQPVVIQNKVGAGGTIASTYVANSKPDGYTLLWTSSSVQVIAPFVMPKLSWDPIASFEPIGLVAKIPLVMAVNNTLPVKTFRELVDYARANPGKLNYATLGPNTTQNLVMTLIMQRLGISMTQVPYSSAAQIYPDLLEGRVELLLDNMPNVLPFAQRGDLRPLAVATRRRLEVLPNVPTIAETAVPDFEMGGWVGLVAPAGTPSSIVSTIDNALTKGLQSNEFRSWLQTNGAIAADEVGTQEFASFLKRELGLWKTAAEQSGVAVEK